ncbi:MAG TPA: mannosyltransferase family protein [Acidimicrobiales bacterium]|nr:mannosyltransferase family protein [Acidimicrobiales bacterium]
MTVGQWLGQARPATDVDLLVSAVEPAVADRRTSRPLEVPGRRATGPSRLDRWRQELAWPFLVYGSTRLALIVLAVVCDVAFGSVVPKLSISHEFGNWDGWWYIRVATLGYPTQISHAQTTLGFFPLYSMVMWLVSHLLMSSYVIGGLVVSLVGGLVATVLVQRLATDWWGPEVARKAVLVFCLFPGSVVFTMDYSEGLLIPLVAGTMLALHHRRWLLAGVLAGLATGIGPDALTVVAMCATASLVQFWRYGWRDSEARRSLVAPLLAPAGAVAFALFLKVWTGSFFASFIAQRDGWHESTSPLAIPNQLVGLAREVTSPAHLAAINLNNIVALLGTAFLVVGLRWLWRDRRTLPVEVWVYVAAMTFLMVTSAHVPPNPRLLITAFPVVLVFAKWVHGQAWRNLVYVTAASLIGLSALTFVGSVLRP